MLNIRYRFGVVGESARVVHAATTTPEGQLVSLCGQTFDPELMEVAHGMPCMSCVRITATLGDRNRRIEHERRIPRSGDE
ncbi:hypothetical protein [Parasphingorhabdus pacifica]